MRITVIRINGAPPQQPLAFDFDERGGGIGREEGNELRLPDPERHVSRQQARVVFDGQRFGLVDLGSNPTLVDGRPLGRGERQSLLGGELVTIGQYELEVGPCPLVGKAPEVDPLGLLVPREGAESSPSGAAPPAAASDDPFAVFSVPESPSALAAIPEPDPFAAPAPAPTASPGRDPLGLGRQAGSASIDDLFGLKGKAGDPFAGTPLGPAAPAAGGSETRDPLTLLCAEGFRHPVASASPQRDDTPLLEQAYRPPSPVASTAPASSEADQPGPVTQVGPESPQGMVLSWDAGAPSSPAAAPPAGSGTSGPMVAERLPGQQVRLPVAAHEGDLLAAFQRGLGVPLNLSAGLTPDLMEQVGVMLRESTQGTLDLLKARAITKREVRAEATMIVSRDNNPLKFSPDIDFALAQLLTSRSRGFMGAQEAMRDAYDDLRAHQFGVMAGMRSALAGVLKRFEPAELEARVGALSLLDKLQPSGRKARLWDLFEQHYAELSREAADDFNALFGRAFLEAYQQQVDLMRARREQGEDPAGRPS